MEKWVVSIFLKKYAKRLILILIAWVAGHNLDQFGVTLDEEKLSLAIWSGLELLRNWLKVRWGVKFL